MVLCKELNEQTYLNRTIELINNQLNDNKYSILDEYYVVNKYIDQDTIKASGLGINRYGLSYPGVARQMYLVFLTPKASKNQHMISVIYAKYNYGWKVSQLDLEPYTINGKTAPELFELARQNYKDHYLIDAENNLSLGATCISPSTVWQYPIQSDQNDFSEKVINEANKKYKYPFIINQLATKPQLIRIYNTSNDEGTYPMVYYLSKINLADTNAIKKENDQLKNVIGKVMPGLDKGKKYIFYSVFNEKPSILKSVAHFDIRETLN